MGGFALNFNQLGDAEGKRKASERPCCTAAGLSDASTGGDLIRLAVCCSPSLKLSMEDKN